MMNDFRMNEKIGKNDKMNIQEASRYISGLQETMPDAFFHLAEVLKFEAFELCRPESGNDYLVPYMMNDALEYYFLLKDARMTGEFDKDSAILSAQIVQEEDRYVLILRQENGNTTTLLFRDLEEHAACYRYHEIGHFWRKGQEHWRQLVYMIGTAHDKYEFFGDRFCNEKEKHLIQLMHFRPFRYWSPISESLDANYPEQEEGLQCMEQIAAEAGDEGFMRLLQWYRHLPFGFMRRWMSAWMIRQMQSPDRQKLYECICRKVDEASSEYPARSYEEGMQAEITRRRAAVDQMLREKGFRGSYPDYVNEADAQKKVRITVAEEHPFTRSDLDWDEFHFRIRLMVSRIEDEKRWISGRNAGFFRGKGRTSEIIEAEEFMK